MGELHAVLLAAGGSSRLGRSKQLIELHDEPLVRRAARLLAGITPKVSVITGARVGQVSEALAGLDVDERHNPRWREGVGGSIALATTGFEPGTRAALILLCDQFRVNATDLGRLVSAWRDAPEHITAARWEDNFGPPVIFPDRFFSALGRLRGDLGARQLLVEQRSRVHYVDMPNAAFDVDDAVDLERLRAWEQASG